MKKLFLIILFPLFSVAMDQPVAAAAVASVPARGRVEKPAAVAAKKPTPAVVPEKPAAVSQKKKEELLNSSLFLTQFRDMRYYHLKMKVRNADGEKCAPYKDLLLTAMQYAALHQHKLWPTENFKPTYDEKWSVEAVYIHRAQQRVAEIVDEVCPSGEGFLESMQLISGEINDKYKEKFSGQGSWSIPASKVPDTKPEQTIKEAATLKMIIDNYDKLTGVSMDEMVGADQQVSRRIADRITSLSWAANPEGMSAAYEALQKQFKVADAK